MSGEEEEDIYGDIDVPYIDVIRKLHQENARLQEKVRNVRDDLGSSRDECERLRNRAKTLEYNISSLYKTAKAEVQRKDKQLKDMRAEVERLAIREARCRYTREEIADLLMKTRVEPSPVFIPVPTNGAQKIEKSHKLGNVTITVIAEQWEFQGDARPRSKVIVSDDEEEAAVSVQAGDDSGIVSAGSNRESGEEKKSTGSEDSDRLSSGSSEVREEQMIIAVREGAETWSNISQIPVTEESGKTEMCSVSKDSPVEKGASNNLKSSTSENNGAKKQGASNNLKSSTSKNKSAKKQAGNRDGTDRKRKKVTSRKILPDSTSQGQRPPSTLSQTSHDDARTSSRRSSSPKQCENLPAPVERKSRNSRERSRSPPRSRHHRGHLATRRYHSSSTPSPPRKDAKARVDHLSKERTKDSRHSRRHVDDRPRSRTEKEHPRRRNEADHRKVKSPKKVSERGHRTQEERSKRSITWWEEDMQRRPLNIVWPADLPPEKQPWSPRAKSQKRKTSDPQQGKSKKQRTSSREKHSHDANAVRVPEPEVSERKCQAEKLSPPPENITPPSPPRQTQPPEVKRPNPPHRSHLIVQPSPVKGQLVAVPKANPTATPECDPWRLTPITPGTPKKESESALEAEAIILVRGIRKRPVVLGDWSSSTSIECAHVEQEPQTPPLPSPDVEEGEIVTDNES